MKAIITYPTKPKPVKSVLLEGIYSGMVVVRTDRHCVDPDMFFGVIIHPGNSRHTPGQEVQFCHDSFVAFEGNITLFNEE